MQELTNHQQNSTKLQQELKDSIIAVPPVLLPFGEATDMTFSAAMVNLQIATLFDIITQSAEQISSHKTQINELAHRIRQKILITDSAKIIEHIKLLIQAKSLVSEIILWFSVIANVAEHLVIKFDIYLSDELLDNIRSSLSAIASTVDKTLNSIPSNSMFGITLTPALKQVSETKAVIDNVLSKIVKINQENEEASKDWGETEQKAYERILEGSDKNVPVKEALEWLAALEQGHDV